jgi:hypothetical protein
MRDRVAEIKKIVNSNQFWELSTGEHQNMIDILLEYIGELEESKSKEVINEGCDSDAGA